LCAYEFYLYESPFHLLCDIIRPRRLVRSLRIQAGRYNSRQVSHRHYKVCLCCILWWFDCL